MKELMKLGELFLEYQIRSYFLYLRFISSNVITVALRNLYSSGYLQFSAEFRKQNHLLRVEDSIVHQYLIFFAAKQYISGAHGKKDF
jgi:hypothetical protein